MPKLSIWFLGIINISPAFASNSTASTIRMCDGLRLRISRVWFSGVDSVLSRKILSVFLSVIFTNFSYNLSDSNGPKPSSPRNELPIVKINNLS